MAEFDLIIVDDEEDIRPLFEHYFGDLVESKKVQLSFVTSAKACLRLLEEKRLSNIHILSDINMPDMSGEELLRKIRALSPSIQVSFISAYEESEYKDLDYVYYFKKPLDFELVVDKIKNMLNP